MDFYVLCYVLNDLKAGLNVNKLFLVLPSKTWVYDIYNHNERLIEMDLTRFGNEAEKPGPQ